MTSEQYLLPQGDSQVLKRFSQAKLSMMREALSTLDRKAYERGAGSFTPPWPVF